MDSTLRAQVYFRSQSRCERCGKNLKYEDMAAHHRKLRSQGGKDEPSNLVCLDHACHNLATNSVHLKPGQASKYGWIVKSFEEPAAKPVLLHGRRPVLLAADGTYTNVEYCFNCQTSTMPCVCISEDAS
jgi:hypothetical protein